MMMRSYCRKVACVEKRMYVNSMRYKKGLRVGSRTDGLLYTAFAARFETSVEESVLRGAVRVGL